MTRCIKCRKRNHMELHCKWCNSSVCTSCLQPEIHRCVGLKECAKYQLKELDKRLHSERVIHKKIESI